MNTTKILDSEISDLKIASLPSRPTAPASFGGKGFTASEMKEAFDKLSLFIIKRFNMLLDDIASYGEGSLCAEIPTGINENHTLADFFRDVTEGNLASYLSVGEETLYEMKERLKREKNETDEKIALCLSRIESFSGSASVANGEDEI